VAPDSGVDDIKDADTPIAGVPSAESDDDSAASDSADTQTPDSTKTDDKKGNGVPTATNTVCIPAAVTDIKIWMLAMEVDSSWQTYPWYNCGYYNDGSLDRLVGYSDDNKRTLQPSGCKLFALCSYLGSSGIWLPNCDPHRLSDPISTPVPPNVAQRRESWSHAQRGPRNFLHYLWHWIQKLSDDNPDPRKKIADPRQDVSTRILAPSPLGALYFEQSLCNAVNQLAGDSHVNGQLTFDSCQLPAAVASGQAIPELSAAIRDERKPALLGIGSSSGTGHVVLAVGFAEISKGAKTETYYIVSDSGYGPQDPSELLPPSGTNEFSKDKLTLGGIVRHSLPRFHPSTDPKATKHTHIFGYTKLSGFEVMDVITNACNPPASP
jgi:hypothetical protein